MHGLRQPGSAGRHQQHRVLAQLMVLRAQRRRPSVATAASASAASSTPAAALTPNEQQLLTSMMNYQHTIDLPEGQLVIAPLRVEHLQRAGDLLADAFVDAKQIHPYRRYVRRNIGKYLEAHINLPPSAVLLTAILRTTVADPNADLHPLHAYATNSSSSSSSASQQQQQEQGQKQDQEQEQRVHPISRLLVQKLGWLVTPGDAAGTPKQPAAAAADGMSSSSSSSSEAGQQQQEPASSAQQQADAGSSSGGGVSQLVSSALAQLAQLGQQQQQQQRWRRPAAAQTRVVEQLLGVVEVSFKESTRSAALTLNPPQRCAYLCNMAVSNDWRRRGVASALLAAVEDMCQLAGEQQLYLHLRFRDDASAGSLYRGVGGFAEAGRDCLLVKLLGYDPRFLMVKQLAPGRRLAGRVRLPAAEQQQLQLQEDAVQQQPDGPAAGAAAA